MKKTGLLDLLAEQHRTFISNLRLLPVIIGRPDQLDTAVLKRIQITINQKVRTALINNRHLIK